MITLALNSSVWKAGHTWQSLILKRYRQMLCYLHHGWTKSLNTPQAGISQPFHVPPGDLTGPEIASKGAQWLQNNLLHCLFCSSCQLRMSKTMRAPFSLQPSSRFAPTACWTSQYVVMHSKHNWAAWICASSLFQCEIKNKKLKIWAAFNFTVLDDSWFCFYEIYWCFLFSRL